MTSPPSWLLLPPDLIEQQISQIDLLLAMYPDDDEVTLDTEAQKTLDIFREHVENNNPISGFPSKAAPFVPICLTTSIPGFEDKKLHLDISIPFSYTPDIVQPTYSPEEPPRIKIRMRQPQWMDRATATQLNADLSTSEDLFSAISNITEHASKHLSNKPQDTQDTPSNPSSSFLAPKPLVRVWFYFPSISTRSKRDDLITNAPSYSLTGFLFAGKPGLLCLEGASQDIDDYMKFIKTESWGDIPAHHKKVSERYRETDVKRVWEDMREVTDEVGERRGARGNRGDMRAVEAWLGERGLGEALGRVLM